MARYAFAHRWPHRCRPRPVVRGFLESPCATPKTHPTSLSATFRFADPIAWQQRRPPDLPYSRHVYRGDRLRRTPYLPYQRLFHSDHIFLDALKAAAARGVDVQVLVPWQSNHVIADWLARGYFTDCLESGIRVFCYQHAMIHAKTCTIDGQWSTIGTANLDRLSSVGNYEINVEVYSKELARQMEALFECDKTNAVELTLDAWVKRSWLAILSEEILEPLRLVM